MIEPSHVLGAFAVGYVVVAVALAVVVHASHSGERRLGYVLVAAPAVGGLDMAMQASGVGTVVVAGTPLALSYTLADLYIYTVAYGVTLLVGGVTTRRAVVIVGITLTMRLSYVLTQIGGRGSLLASVGLGTIVVGYLTLVYFFVRPVWETAQSVEAKRRLIHWKARNVLLVVFLMLTLGSVLTATGIVSDPVLGQLMAQYANFVVRAGVPAFLIYKLQRGNSPRRSARNVVKI